jgi:hypothetical protein
MKTITFSDKELEFLKQQYADELAGAEKYVDQVKEILNKLGVPFKPMKDQPINNEPKTLKKRGRKPKVKVIETKEPKKRGRPRKNAGIPETGIVPVKNVKAVIKEVGKNAEPKVPKKRGRKPKALLIPKSEPKQAPAKEVKKIGRIKSTRKRNRKWKGVRLTNWSKPIQLKEPPVEPADESGPVVETVVVPMDEPKE